ncbi:MAG: NAD(P)/FAD-dependent oxidoreductase [Xanthobacteraceae bacterium]
MQVLVVGAGVIGLAVARALALRGHEVVVAEAANTIGTGISSRNSEVVHGGLYYPTGSRRAYHCPRSRRMLYAFCESHGVPHRKAGKLVVATSQAELPSLEKIFKQSEINGVEGIEIIDQATANRLEPKLSCVAAMHSPETGVVDSHRLMLALRGDLEDRGGVIAFNTRIHRLSRAQTGWLAFFGDDGCEFLHFDAVINSAGLGAQRLARETEGYPAERVPRLVLAKGNYFGCSPTAFSRLIYPVPVPGGLGVHVTIDLAGRMRFGPDVEWIESENYDVDAGRAQSFYERIRTYWPALPDGALTPDYCGIRPKLSGPGEPPRDFLIEGPAQHGLNRFVNLFGIESPGLTCALSIAEEVAGYLSA